MAEDSDGGPEESGRERGDEDRLRRIEAMLWDLHRRVKRLEVRAHEAQFEAVDEPTVPPAPESAQPAERPWQAVAPTEASEPATQPGPSAERTAGQKFDIESVLGANWLAKAGMAVLVLGVVFLFRYAFDQGWISLPFQILIGVVAGLLLVALGEVMIWRRRYGVYPQVLAGGGAAITAFSVYASYAFEAYRDAIGTTLEMASVGLGVVAAAFLAYTAWRRTPVLTAEAVVLGGLTAVFAESWEPFAVAYILLIASAALAAAAWRRWDYVGMTAVGVGEATLLVLLAMDVDPLLAAVAATAMAAAGLAAALWRDWEYAAIVSVAAGQLVLVAALESQADARWVGVAAAALSTAAVAAAAWRTWRPAAHAALAVGLGALAFVSIDEPNAVLLMLGVVTAAGIATAWSRHWPDVLLTAGLNGVLGGFAAFGSDGATSWILAYAGGILVVLVAASWLVEDRDQLAALAAGLAFLGPWALALLALERGGWDEWRGPLTLTLGVIAAAGVLASTKSTSRLGWGVAGLVMLLAWPPIQFDGSGTALAWSGLVAAAAAVLWLRPNPMVRAGMGVGSVLLVGHLLVDDAPRIDDDAIASWLGLVVFTVGAVALLVAWLADVTTRGTNYEATSRVFLAAPLFVMIVYFSVALEGFAVSIAWAAEAVVVVVAGFVARKSDLRIAGLAVFALVLGRVFLVDLTQLDMAFRIVTFLVVGALLLLASFLFARSRQDETDVPAKDGERS